MSMDHSINYNITGTDLERTNIEDLIYYLDTYWWFSIVASFLYVIVIFGGRQLMKSYNKFNLTYPLVVWNLMLAVFSMIGTIRLFPNLHYALTHLGFHDSVCSAEWASLPVVRMWTFLFALSKIVELGDTVFIVLRKQPLILLHWYHHITVLIYTWNSVAERTSSGRWYITMNYAVHSIMYMYYAASALKYRAPNAVKMCITLFQLSQMVVGVYIAVYVYKLKQSGVTCGITDSNMRLSFAMYFSYFLLFAKFFYDAYLKPKPKRPSKSESNGHQMISNGVTANGHTLNGQAHRYNTRSKKLE